MARSCSWVSAEWKFPGTSPGTAVPRNTRWVPTPLLDAPGAIVGAAPKNTVRASRLVSARCPRTGLALSIRTGSELGPSTSASMIAFHESCRYWVSSLFTFAVASGIEPGMISGEASSPTHSAWMTVDISRRTPRVRWNRSSDDHSSYRVSNSSGWIG